MSMVLKQLNDFLTDNGLQPIDAVGQKFDPNLHEAIAPRTERKSSRRPGHSTNPARLSFEGSAAASIERGGFERRRKKR